MKTTTNRAHRWTFTTRLTDLLAGLLRDVRP